MYRPHPRQLSLAVLILTVAGFILVAPQVSHLHAAGPACTVATSGGTYTSLASALTDPGCSTIQITAGTFATNVTVSRSVIIEGAGPTSTLLDGGGTDRFTRVLLVEPNITVELRNLAVVNGDAGNPAAGGIYNSGTMTLTNVLVQGNAGGGSGGLFNDGSLAVVDSTIANNRGRSSGAILNNGTLSVSRSTISGNSGTSSGIINTSQLTLVNATFSGNTSQSGPVINNFSGTTTIQFSTIVSNTGGFAGDTPQASALANPTDGTLTIRASIVASNGPGPNCESGITSLGHNIADDATCNLTGNGDKPDTDPKVLPRAANGGSTQTHLPQQQSPAVDAGPATECPATDQRGIARPTDGDGRNGAGCDIGAVELVVQAHKVSLPLIVR